MIAFVGRNAKILCLPAGSPYYAVHILMERESGKTLDCFIEVASVGEAIWVARQATQRSKKERPCKLSGREIKVTVSSHDELMAELFPRAKHVRWIDGKPVVDRSQRSYYAGQAASGFQGFLHTEELVALKKHALLAERVGHHADHDEWTSLTCHSHHLLTRLLVVSMKR
jgi:hypothetical protein